MVTRGGFIKGVGTLHASVLSLIWFAAIHAAPQEEIERLKAKREFALEQLDRIENGRRPCYSSECQARKRELIDTLFKGMDRLPHLPLQDAEKKAMAFQSAYRLIDKAFIRPHDGLRKPQNLREWAKWWQRRFSYETELRSNWMSFYSDLVSMERFLTLAPRHLTGLEQAEHSFAEDWKSGLGEAAYFFEQALKEERLRNEEGWRSPFRQKYLRIEERLQHPLSFYLKRHFPNRTPAEAISFLIHLRTALDEFGSSEFFDPQFQSFLVRLRRHHDHFIRTIRDYSDLEYGVFGLNSFESDLNPFFAASNELEVQQTLDQVDALLRGALDLGQFSLSLAGAREFALGSRWLMVGLVGGLTFLQEDYNLKWSAQIPHSSRSTEILMQLPRLENEMLKRHETLFIAKKEFQKKIDELNAAIEQAE